MDYDPTIHGTLADWVSGIGTLLAIIISLYLTLKDNYKKLIVSSYFNYYLYDQGNMSNEPFLSIEIVNNGKVPVNVTQLGFSKFKINKRMPNFIREAFPRTFGMMQIINLREDSNQLPCMIKPQELKKFSFKGNANSLRNSKYIGTKTRVYVKDSTGKVFYSKKKTNF